MPHSGDWGLTSRVLYVLFVCAVICNYLMHFSDKIFCCIFFMPVLFWMFFILYLSIVMCYFFSQDMDMGISCTCWKCGRTWICIITSVSFSWLAYGENITSLKQKVFLCWMFFLMHTFFSPCVCVRACARVLLMCVCVCVCVCTQRTVLTSAYSLNTSLNIAMPSLTYFSSLYISPFNQVLPCPSSSVSRPMRDHLSFNITQY